MLSRHGEYQQQWVSAIPKMLLTAVIIYGAPITTTKEFLLLEQ